MCAYLLPGSFSLQVDIDERTQHEECPEGFAGAMMFKIRTGISGVKKNQVSISLLSFSAENFFLTNFGQNSVQILQI
jgi:hypothetical protein